MNILYYGVDNSPSTDGIKFGPYINLTLQQISIGIITNLIVFPPSILLVQMFRRIKRRKTHISELKLILNQNNLINSIDEEANNNEIKFKNPKKKSFELKFPWWFKFIAYAISFVFALVSLFFVVIKGIEFGDEKVTKWLSSLIISFLSSILLTQPLQVKNILVFRFFKLMH